MTRNEVSIQSMTSNHWPEVAQIYQEGLDTGLASFETQVPNWPDWDKAHHRFARLVATIKSEVVGWAALSPTSSRKVYAGVAEVSIYVSLAHSGIGIGGQLMTALIQTSGLNGIWTLQSSIFPENKGSTSLHQKFGFRVVGKRERIAQHHGQWRDTYILERRKN